MKHLFSFGVALALLCVMHTAPGSGAGPGATPPRLLRQRASKLWKPTLSAAGTGGTHQWRSDRATAVQREGPLSAMALLGKAPGLSKTWHLLDHEFREWTVPGRQRRQDRRLVTGPAVDVQHHQHHDAVEAGNRRIRPIPGSALGPVHKHAQRKMPRRSRRIVRARCGSPDLPLHEQWHARKRSCQLGASLRVAGHNAQTRTVVEAVRQRATRRSIDRVFISGSFKAALRGDGRMQPHDRSKSYIGQEPSARRNQRIVELSRSSRAAGTAGSRCR